MDTKIEWTGDTTPNGTHGTSHRIKVNGDVHAVLVSTEATQDFDPGRIRAAAERKIRNLVQAGTFNPRTPTAVGTQDCR